MDGRAESGRHLCRWHARERADLFSHTEKAGCTASSAPRSVFRVGGKEGWPGLLPERSGGLRLNLAMMLSHVQRRTRCGHVCEQVACRSWRHWSATYCLGRRLMIHGDEESMLMVRKFGSRFGTIVRLGRMRLGRRRAW